MKVWTVVGYFDGETDVTAHLTRKGALAEAIKTLWGIIGATSGTTHHDEFGARADVSTGGRALYD